VWLVKNRLCALRIDPGTVNGDVNERFREALRAFQAREGLPQTGEADVATLSRLGFSSSDVIRMSDLINRRDDDLPGLQLPWMLLIPGLGAGLFMVYALSKYLRS
jgi:peptidoglycan hydrolase-like protein with peptidoglycan-binding domain